MLLFVEFESCSLSVRALFVTVSSHDVPVVVYSEAAMEKSDYLKALQDVISDLESRGFMLDAEKRPPPPPKREAAAVVDDARVRALETDLTCAREWSVKERVGGKCWVDDVIF